MKNLILVKHAMPEITPGIPAREWRLSREGRLACKPLAEALRPFAPERIFTSNEPKALETGQLAGKFLGLPAHPFPGLHEHDRARVKYLSLGEFESAIQAFFAHPAELAMGAETADQAYTRFSAAVDELLARHPGKTLALFTHGTVISLFATRRAGGDPFDLWNTLDLPSFLVLPLPGLNEIVYSKLRFGN